MSRFLQLHALTAYPPSNPNRDDLGRPKTAVFGGCTRLRISSQSLKRAFRQSEAFQEALRGTLGERTQRMGKIVADHLISRQVPEEEAIKIARKVAHVFGEPTGNKEAHQAFTKQLAFISPDERKRTIDLADKLNADALPENKNAREKLASFGERAGNARRGSADRPTRSALLGLLGAALGIDRADAEGQAALAAGYAVATRAVRPGAILRDYHTFQSLPAAAGHVGTRADALRRRNDLETSVTTREYRSDVVFDAAIRAKEGARWSLAELANALRRPHYVLQLWRRSCPLAWPLDPAVVEADGVIAAFALRDADRPRELRGPADRWTEVAAECPEDFGRLNREHRRIRRIDEPGDRIARRFYPREEFITVMDMSS
jgi:CRISPR system Cascade subunit CasD